MFSSNKQDNNSILYCRQNALTDLVMQKQIPPQYFFKNNIGMQCLYVTGTFATPHFNQNSSIVFREFRPNRGASKVCKCTVGGHYLQSFVPPGVTLLCQVNFLR